MKRAKISQMMVMKKRMIMRMTKLTTIMTAIAIKIQITVTTPSYTQISEVLFIKQTDN